VSVLLINPPWKIKRENIWAKIGGVLPPLSLGYLASVLRQQGLEVEILDMNALSIPVEDLPRRLSGKKYDWIGITATTNLINNAYRLAELARSQWPEARIVMGGVHPTVLPDEVLTFEAVDYVVRGEGETTVAELVSGVSPENISGLSYRADGQVVHNPDRDHIPDLDTIPFPAYDLLPVGQYIPALGGYKRLPAISVITSRGCSGSCTYCNNFFGRRVRKRSSENIIQELKLLIDRFGIKEIYFFDDSFTEFPSKVKELCERMIQERLDLTWSCFTRFQLVNEDLLRAMREAGCRHISYGIESADPEILRGINKPTDLDKVREVISLTHKVGIETLLGFMLGLPGETRETMEKTMQFAVSLDPDMVLFDITTPFPGTQMFRWARDKGYLKTEDWSEYDLYTVIMDLPTISESEIRDFYSRAHRRFYLRPGYLVRRLFKTRSWLDLKQNMIAFLTIMGL
jgi:anaerobic magnesium-protoporphyrin IX monomethyl ester cyclase